jgi:uncharacterized membrane protein YhaH (DUF805 family)
VERDSDPAVDYTRRHLRFGWWSLLCFLSLGVVLELLHGFKAGLYLDVSNQTRRLMWTLAHAHGTLLGLVHILYALCLRMFPNLAIGPQRPISLSLIGASVLLPGGFFLGGVSFYSGDPGLGILAVPVGATLLVIAVFLIARASGPIEGEPGESGQDPGGGTQR